MRKVLRIAAPIPATKKTGHDSISLPGGGAFPERPCVSSFRSHYLPRWLLVRRTLWFSMAQPFLGACTTHVHGCCAAIIIEYLQTATKTVARGSVSEDVNLRSHFSS